MRFQFKKMRLAPLAGLSVATGCWLLNRQTELLLQVVAVTFRFEWSVVVVEASRLQLSVAYLQNGHYDVRCHY
jgi:orotate phosphoribosyltransferase-like protein